MARRIATAAEHISVRTSASATHAIFSGLNVQLGRDPAFDYLASRDSLSLLRKCERESVNRLLRDTEKRLCVGVNVKLRYSRSAPSKPAETYFLEAVAEGLVRFAREAGQPVSYVYFSMDATQSGRSDLTGAFLLQRLIHGEADFRVWEADADVDALVYLLKHLKLALTMRFHAAICALSQNLPVVGILCSGL